jgi:hypothetical protein
MKKKSENKTMHRGVKYDHNPFLALTVVNTKHGVKRIIDKSGTKMMVVSESGEVLAPAGFWQTQQVDKTQFVKLYINGVKAFKDLTGAGTKVFELLYLRVQENIGQDKILLSFTSIDQKATPISSATFYRGVRELVEKGFIAESITIGVFYLNPDYMWNGDRLAFVKEYRKAPSSKKNIVNNTLDWVEQIKAEEVNQEK